MGDISILEFIVYGILAYGSMIMILITTIKDIPDKRALSIARSIFLLPGMIAAGILAFSGNHITWLSQTTTTITKNYNVTANQLVSNSTSTLTQTSQFTLISDVWLMVHFMIFIVLLFFVIMQILIFFTKTE